MGSQVLRIGHAGDDQASWAVFATPKTVSLWFVQFLGFDSDGREAALLYVIWSKLTVDRCNRLRCSLTKNALPRIAPRRGRAHRCVCRCPALSRVDAASVVGEEFPMILLDVS